MDNESREIEILRMKRKTGYEKLCHRNEDWMGSLVDWMWLRNHL
jgi:hypothetical protein